MNVALICNTCQQEILSGSAQRSAHLLHAYPLQGIIWHLDMAATTCDKQHTPGIFIIGFLLGTESLES